MGRNIIHQYCNDTLPIDIHAHMAYEWRAQVFMLANTHMEHISSSWRERLLRSEWYPLLPSSAHGNVVIAPRDISWLGVQYRCCTLDAWPSFVAEFKSKQRHRCTKVLEKAALNIAPLASSLPKRYEQSRRPEDIGVYACSRSLDVAGYVIKSPGVPDSELLDYRGWMGTGLWGEGKESGSKILGRR